MFELLYQKLIEKITLSEEEFDLCKGFFIPRRLRRKHFLLQEGNVCKYTAFLEKGLLRSYTVDKKGAEHILQFAFEGWWIADIYSFLTHEPSMYNIEALEDTELLLITKTSLDTLMEKLPGIEHYFHVITQNHLIATQRRLMGSLTETAEERYLTFIKLYPDCLARVPQHMIASYLGITRETLSRIRKEMAGK